MCIPRVIYIPTEREVPTDFLFFLAGTQADAPIKFSQLSKTNDLAAAGDIFELGLSQALGTSKKESAADFR